MRNNAWDFKTCLSICVDFEILMFNVYKFDIFGSLNKFYEHWRQYEF